MKQQIITLSFLLISWIGFSQKTFKLEVIAEGSFGTANGDVFRVNTTVNPATTSTGIFQAANASAGMDVLQDYAFSGNKALLVEKPSGIGRVIIASYPDLTTIHTFSTSNAPQTLAFASPTKAYVFMGNPKSIRYVNLINNTMTPVSDPNSDLSAASANMVYANGMMYVQSGAKILKIDTVTNAVSGVILPAIGTIAGLVYNEADGKIWILNGSGSLRSIDISNGDALGTVILTGAIGTKLLRIANEKLYFWSAKNLFIYNTQTPSILPLTAVYTSSLTGAFAYGRSFDVDKNTGDFVICSAGTYVAPSYYEVVDGTTFTIIESGSVPGANIANKCYLQTFEAVTPDLATLPNATGECSVSLSAPTANSGTITATTVDSTVYSAQGDYTVTWTYNNNGTTITQTQEVAVHDVTAPVAVVATLPNLDITCNVAITAIPTATDNCDSDLTATTSDSLSYTTAGTYTIIWKYTDAAGNVTTQNQVIIVTCSTTGLDELTADKASIYPNPATDFITIESTSLKSGKIINVNGQEVMTFNVNSTPATIQIAHLPKGLYYVQLVNELNEISTQKLILK
jgi:hypothetical protein